MLRKFLLSTVLVAAAAGSAAAADLPYRSAAPAYAAAPIFTWTGFYVGLNAGAAWSNRDDNAVFYSGFGPGAVISGGFLNGSDDDTGFTGGVTAGYNMQFGSFVAGIEADINYLDRKNGRNGSVTVVGDATAANNGVYSATQGNGDNYYGTVRGRLGFAFDRALIFATGGLAFGGTTGDINGTFTSGGTTYLLNSSGSSKSTGWALGGGIEYAFTNSISMKLEYLHVDFGSNNRTLSIVTPGTVRSATLNSDNKFDVVRAGVNFRF